MFCHDASRPKVWSLQQQLRRYNRSRLDFSDLENRCSSVKRNDVRANVQHESPNHYSMTKLTALKDKSLVSFETGQRRTNSNSRPFFVLLTPLPHNATSTISSSGTTCPGWCINSAILSRHGLSYLRFIIPPVSCPLLQEHAPNTRGSCLYTAEGTRLMLGVSWLLLCEMTSTEESTSDVPMDDTPSESEQPWTYPTRLCRVCLEEVPASVTLYPPGLPVAFQRPVVEYKNDDEYGRLVKPCHCRGGMRYIHDLCLRRLRNESARAGSLWKCHQCGYKFNFNRLAQSKAHLDSKLWPRGA